MGRGHIWGDEARRNIRGREGCLWEIYEGGRERYEGWMLVHRCLQMYGP